MPAFSPSPAHLSKLIAGRPTGAAGTPSSTARAAPAYSSVDGDMRRKQQHPVKKVIQGGHGYVVVVRYTECRRNHAASVGGYAVDGCLEFMASGEEGTPAALKCAACHCHRSFHKREVERELRPCDCSSNTASPV